MQSKLRGYLCSAASRKQAQGRIGAQLSVDTAHRIPIVPTWVIRVGGRASEALFPLGQVRIGAQLRVESVDTARRIPIVPTWVTRVGGGPSEAGDCCCEWIQWKLL